ncbi:MAG TPA: patatin-like phospholipase family protein [Prosthecobacter sp.]|nr:patatin-like phospholipase family protein [Prosthecobacter sp.]
MITTNTHPNPGSGLFREVDDRAGRSGLGSARTVPKIGLALSGGGARGLAHVGVLQVLENERIPIAAVAGTSMGAYVGSLFASGLAGAKLEELAREIKDRRTLYRLMDPIFPPSAGLIRGVKIRKHLERSLGNVTFAELPIPLLVVATELDSLGAYVFDSGPVAAAVHASAAIPGVCTPVCVDGHRLTDGGAAEPLPVTLLRERFPLDAVIAINVLPTSADISAAADYCFVPKRRGPIGRLLSPFNLMAHGNVMDTFRRSLMCSMLRLVEKESKHADIVIHPLFSGSTWFDFENYERYITAGRRAAEAALPAIHQLLENNQTRGEPHHATAPCSSLMVNNAA